MQALAGFLSLGLIVGYARGGSIGNIADARLRRPWLLAIALVLQLAANLPGEDQGALALALVLASFGAVGSFAFANRRAFGMPMIALGAGLNLLVIAVNGGMPVSAEAFAAVGGDPAEVIRGKHFLDDGSARLRLLGDVIAWPLRPRIVSIGDLILWTGISLLVSELMQPLRRAPRTEEPATR